MDKRNLTSPCTTLTGLNDTRALTYDDVVSEWFQYFLTDGAEVGGNTRKRNGIFDVFRIDFKGERTSLTLVYFLYIFVRESINVTCTQHRYFK